MKHLLCFVGALASAGCADRGPVLQQPVGTTTVQLPAAAADAGPAPPAPPPASAEVCTDPPVVTFVRDETAVSEPQIDTLLRFAQCLNAAPNEGTTVVLIGYTDLIGTVPANIELGIVRAQSVMKHLTSGGVAPGRIVVASAGELQRPSARMGLHAPRVEVLIARGGPVRPNEAPIARGIDAEGLVRRPPSQVAPAPAPAPTPNRPPPTRPPRNR